MARYNGRMGDFQLRRLDEAMVAAGHSQSSLARAIGVTQGTISKILLGQTSNSRHLPRIAMVLGVSLKWLFDSTDDPTDGRYENEAMSHVVQKHVTLPVALPSEAALTDAFAGVLLASQGMELDELARELAKRLPIVLRGAAGAVQFPPSAADGASRALRPSRGDGPDKRQSGQRR